MIARHRGIDDVTQTALRAIEKLTTSHKWICELPEKLTTSHKLICAPPEHQTTSPKQISLSLSLPSTNKDTNHKDNNDTDDLVKSETNI